MSSGIKTVAVCGAGGTMGAGIAIVAARAGFQTISFDVETAPLDGAGSQTEAFFEKSVARGKMSAEEREATLALMTSTTSLDDLAAADLVIEAIFENLSVKQDLFAKLDAICPADTILAS
ncbi:MAG: 3-hydroxyacyl-CoA dehydrogenase NAD-binding domain-containing protein, partial [Pseudomonadota bacterium]